MKALLLVALLLLPALAGCLAGNGSKNPTPTPGALAPASLLCLPVGGKTECNFQATASPVTRQGNELSIAANPKNPLNIIATAKDYTPNEAGDCVWAGLYTTFDGGATWTNQNVPGSPWKKAGDPARGVQPDPNAPVNQDFSKYWCATDPVVAFGSDGTAYWAVMPYQCDRASGSKTGDDQIPRNPVNGGGGLNDWAYTCSSMYLLVSTDGGKTWPLDKVRMIAEGPLIAEDKEWIAISPDGNKVLYCWDYDDAPSDYAPTPIPTGQPGIAGGGTDVVCSYSTDKANTFQGPFHTNSKGAFAWLDFSADGTAWMASVSQTAAGGNVYISSSKDLKTWSAAQTIATYKMPPNDPAYVNERGWQTLEGSAFRLVPYGALAIDRSNGPNAGSLYVLYFTMTDGAKPRGDVLLVASHDNGKTWSAPKRVADAPADIADRFMPSLSVGPNGTIDASWWDRRNDPKNHLFDLYYSYSKDGGVTWAPNLRVSNVSSDEQYSHHQNGMIFLGDYRGQSSTTLGAHLVWVDTRNHKADVFTAIVQR